MTDPAGIIMSCASERAGLLRPILQAEATSPTPRTTFFASGEKCGEQPKAEQLISRKNNTGCGPLLYCSAVRSTDDNFILIRRKA